MTRPNDVSQCDLTFTEIGEGSKDVIHALANGREDGNRGIGVRTNDVTAWDARNHVPVDLHDQK